MPANLPTVGNISYTLPSGASHVWGVMTETIGIQGKPVYDSAGRVVVHVEWTLTIKETLAATPGQTIDATVETLRNLLMTNGGQLVYTDKGFSSVFSINTKNIRDVIFGPKPRSF